VKCYNGISVRLRITLVSLRNTNNYRTPSAALPHSPNSPEWKTVLQAIWWKDGGGKDLI
jgi:hypothetical protein